MGIVRSNLVCGGIFACIGLFFVVDAWRTLPIGEASSMGPGYFPIGLGLLLIVLGLVIGFGESTPDTRDVPPLPWRGVTLVTGSVLFFGLTVRSLGFAPSLLVSTFVAGLATGRLKTAPALALGVVLTAFAIAVFVIGLGMPYPVIGPWLGG
ncbi:MAG: tripartite tricarboxylate transporter TctB family protein [Microvirga sp.]